MSQVVYVRYQTSGATLCSTGTGAFPAGAGPDHRWMELQAAAYSPGPTVVPAARAPSWPFDTAHAQAGKLTFAASLGEPSGAGRLPNMHSVMSL